MKITNDQITTLLNFAAMTSEDEVSCQACEDQIAQFAETQLTGKEIPEALKVIEEHLRVCPECSEELGFISRALEADFIQNNPDAQ